MKICLLSGSYPPIHCGVGDQVQCLAEGLAAAGETVAVVTSAGGLLPVSNRITIHPVISNWRAGSMRALLRIMDRINPDIIHLHYPSLGFGHGLAPNLFFPLLRCLRPQWKCLVTLHEYFTYTLRGRWRLWPVIRSAQRIVCTNQLDQKYVLKDHAAGRARIQVIPLGSSVGSLQQNDQNQLKPFPLPAPDKNWLLHFGTVMPNKGWEVMIPALQQLIREGRKIGLLVAGELDPASYVYHRKIRSMIQDAGLTDTIYFTGYLSKEQIAEVFTTCSIAVQPYTDGAQLNRSSFIALLAYGRAIITTDPLYLLEHLRHGRQFWGVIPHDPKALAEGIKLLLDDQDLVKRLQTGAAAAADYFAWPRIIKLYYGLYRQLLAQ